MANRATLYVSPTPCSPEDQGLTALLGAKYAIPVLWLALLAPEDRTFLPQRADCPEPCRHHYFSLPGTLALERCRARTPALRELFANIDTFLPSFFGALERAAGQHITIDIAEIVDMGDEAEELACIDLALGVWDTPDEETVTAFVRIASLADAWDPESRMVTTPPPRRIRDVIDAEAAQNMSDAFLDQPLRVTPVATTMRGYAIDDSLGWGDS